MQNCLICDKEYKPNNKNSKYCSNQCKWIAHKGQENPFFKEKIKLICQICKKEYEKNPSQNKNGRSKCCSIECRRKLVTEKMFGHSWNKGQIISKERRKQTSERMKGNKYNVGRKLSEEQKEYLRNINSGEKSCSWKGGITPKNLLIRWSKRMKNWKQVIFNRDNYTCQSCEIKSHNGLGYSVRLEAHHIKSFSDYSELRFDINNGITLCRPCHSIIHFGTATLGKA